MATESNTKETKIVRATPKRPKARRKNSPG